MGITQRDASNKVPKDLIAAAKVDNYEVDSQRAQQQVYAFKPQGRQTGQKTQQTADHGRNQKIKPERCMELHFQDGDHKSPGTKKAAS